MKILNRFNLSVIFECECETIKECVLKAKESNADLRYADLSSADLNCADLSSANLSGAYLYGADLSSANLSGANLGDADLYGADLRDANLRGANLSGAYLFDTNLSNANLYGAKIFNEKLSKNLIYINAGFDYQIWISDTKIKIGCQLHTTIAWSNFTDEEIEEMAGNRVLIFWQKNKDIILAIAKHHQGE